MGSFVHTSWSGDNPQRSSRRPRRRSRDTSSRRRELGTRLTIECLEQRTLLAGDLVVTRLTPTGGSGHPFDTLEVAFSQPVLDGTFLLEDVSVSGPGGSLAAKGLSQLAADRYQIDMTGLTGLATYRLSLGPNIQAADGRLMNQDQDGTLGEPADAYQAALVAGGLTVPANDATFDGQALVVWGANVTLDGAHAFSAVEILGGATVTHSAATATAEYQLDWTITDSLWIDSTSRIDVSGKGYLSGYTVGNTTVGGAVGNAGGTYGGLGFSAAGAATNLPYGDYRQPTVPGSGGGTFNGGNNPGGSGGGVIQVTAASAQIDGAVLAHGVENNTSGSGGSILLDVGTLSGTGSISAGSHWGGNYASSGGGGRVAVYYDDLSGFDATKISAPAGPNSNGPNGGSLGTVFLKQHSEATGQLRIDSHGVAPNLPTPLGLPGDSDFRVDQLVVSGTGAMAVPQHELPIVAGTVLLEKGGVLSHLATTPDNVYTLQVTTGQLTVDAQSKIDVSGKGYRSGDTLGNLPAGGAWGNSGGSYGGAGYVADGATNAVYGDRQNPILPGSGGGLVNANRGGSGGGVVKITTRLAQIDGSVLAQGGQDSGPGGSGGSVLLDARTLAGSGTIAADGAWGGNYTSNGGGGRVAVYRTNVGGFDPAHVTASGVGHGANRSGDGSVVVSQTPYLTCWSGTSLFHDTTPLFWAALGVEAGQALAEITAYKGQQMFTLAADQPATGRLDWDTTTVPDGRYEIRVAFRSASSPALGQAVLEVLVNNSAAWHQGRLAADETWTADRVHIVESSVLVGAGRQLTIEPGAVVKFAPGARLVVESGGTIAAPATTTSPIVLTSLADDSAGGDTNLDGEQTKPRPGDWNGYSVADGGTLTLNAAVDVRYMQMVHSGTLTASETWAATYVHRVSGVLLVPGGVTLTIPPGAVVKFDAGAGLFVQAGGTLQAEGILAQPLVFTSARDDTVGGDTNGDGTATAPAAGDWRSIRLDAGATGRFRYAEIRFGGNSTVNEYGAGGMIESTGATLTIDNSRISESLKDGVLAGGPTTIRTSLIAATDRGVTAFGGTGTVAVVNCTVNDHRLGLLEHGGTLTVHNSLVTNNWQAGIIHDWGTERITVTYSDVWNPDPGAANYSGTADKTGQLGNISADPKYKHAEQGDYRLGYRSPAIDAAEGTVAPPADLQDAPRYDDPRTVNTGTPLPGAGAIPDLGAFEFVETAASAVDLVVASVVAPALAVVGDLVTVQWTITNRGTGEVRGPWHDALALVRNPALPSDSLAVAELLVGAGVVLGAGQSYTASAQVTVPGTVAGQHYWQVATNSRGDVYEGANSRNNSTLSAAQIAIELPVLTVGGAAAAGALTGTGDQRWYQILPEAGQDLRLALDAAAASGAIELLVGQGYMPTAEQFDWKQTEWNSPDASLMIPSTAAQPYYVLVRASSLPGGATLFTLASSALDFSLSAVSPATVGNTGPVTLLIQGGKLTESDTYELIDPQGAAVPASAVFSTDSATAYATFNLVGHPTGAYDVRVGGSGSPAVLSDAVQVMAGPPGKVEVQLSTPNAVRVGRYADLVLEYRNVGTTDVTAPLLLLTVDNGAILTANGESQKVFLLGIASAGPAGVLAPGAHGTATYSAVYRSGGSAMPAGAQVPPSIRYHAPATAGTAEFTVQTVADASAAMDWSSVRDGMRPPSVPADAWPAIFANFTAAVGGTVGSVNAALAQDATYLSRLGVYTGDLGQLTAYEFSQDGLDIIAARYTLGAFGRGLPGYWELTATRDPSDGSVVIRYPQGYRRFTWDAAEQQFAPEPGNDGTLSLDGQAYRLVEKTGEVLVFRPAGQLDYGEFPGGRRITLSYQGSQVTGITDVDGNQTQIEYNPQGRVARLVGPNGIATTFTYDASAEHLTAIADAAGTTQFSYVTGQGAAREHALQSIAWADGTHVFFEYDAQGRLARQARDGQSEAVSYTYDSTGTMTATDSQSAQVRLSPTDLGLLGCFQGARGEIARLFYDAGGNLARVDSSAGGSVTAQYSAWNDLVQGTDPGGGQYELQYETDLDRLVSLADPLGNVTQFEYDSAGNLTGRIDASGQRHSFVSDSAGHVTQETNRRGQPTSYVYDLQGRLTRVREADGTTTEVSYDSHWNVATITDDSGQTQFGYDLADRLVRITYPSGRYLQYTYDSGGRRSRMADASGFAVNYAYDAVGRLARLSEDDGTAIVAYGYDSTGRVARKDLGNGTYTTYAYDASGNLLHLINYAGTGGVESQFDYTYDAAGRASTMATVNGLWTYDYDAGGELTHAVFASTSPTVPNQDLTYVYDALGNRIQTIENGMAAQYRTNNLNQYTQAGTTSYAYDADGNLIGMSDGTGTWEYTYDARSRLVGVNHGADAWTYQYDALGQRSSATHNGVTTVYLVDPLTGDGNVVAEYDPAGAVKSHYVHGLDLASQVAADGTSAYYAFDALGSTSELTGAGGTILNRYAYQPFGGSLSKDEALANPFQFVGAAGVMAETGGLYYMRARFYDPAAGRFLSADPVGIAGGVNLYRYAKNDPVSWSDPTGLAPTPAQFAEFMRLSKLAAEQGLGSQAGALFQSLLRPVDIVSGGSKVQDVDMLLNGLRNLLRNRNLALQSVSGGLAETIGAPMAQTVASPTRTGSRALTRGLSSGFVGRSGLWAAGSRFLGAVGALVTAWQAGQAAGAAFNHFVPPGTWCTGFWDSTFRLSIYLGGGKTNNVGSADPNDMLGPAGFGDAHVIPQEMLLPYTIRFENQSTATASAQEVVVTHQLPDNLDWSTFEIVSLGLNQQTVNVPAGRQSYSSVASVSTDPNPVRIRAALDPATGIVTWSLSSEDPTTRTLPEDPWAGFLPPNNASHQGEGYVSFTIRPKAGLATGTAIVNQAEIVFDVNPVIPTNQVLNTIDAGPPSSQVTALPPTVGPVFTVAWQGADDAGGSGIAAYDVFVADNAGPFTLWQARTTATSANYTGQAGHSYQFYSLATDQVGHRQATPSTAAATQVSVNVWHNFATPWDVDGVGGVKAADVLVLINYINSHPNQPSVPASPASPPPYYDVAGGPGGQGDLLISPLDVLAVINYINSHLSEAGEGEAPASVSWPASEARGRGQVGNELGGSLDRWSPSEIVAHDRELARPDVRVPGPVSAGVPEDRILESADDLCSPWEDILPELAADVGPRWGRRPDA